MALLKRKKTLVEVLDTRFTDNSLSFLDQAKTTLTKPFVKPKLGDTLYIPPEKLDPPPAKSSSWVDHLLSLKPKRSLTQVTSLTPIPASTNPEALTQQRRQAAAAKIKMKMGVAGVGLVSSIAGLTYPMLGLVGGLAVIYNGIDVVIDTIGLLKQKRFTVDIFISGAILGFILTGRFLIGNIATLLLQTSFLLLNKVKSEASHELGDAFKQTPQFAWVMVDGVEVSLPIDQLQPGQIVIVQAGEVIPVDGVVVEGMATVDQHILTGEARPVERGVGEQVFTSTVVLSGKIQVEVQKTGAETAVAQIGQILSRTTDFKSQAVLRAEALANRTVIPTLVLTTLALPFIGVAGALGIFDAHFKRRMTLLTPISILNYFSIASKQGVLIKDGRSLDLLYDVDTIVFDKTGTLTESQPTVGQIHVCAEYAPDEILRIAAAAEFKQTHPIALAIVTAAEQRGLELPQVMESEYKIGYGLSVTIENKHVQVGSYRFMRAEQISLPSAIEVAQTHCHEQGYSLVMVAADGQLIGAIELVPTIRPEAKLIIEKLKMMPRLKETVIISGDSDTPTRLLAQQLGIDRYFAEILPEQKAALIDQLQQEGKRVCYIGDGINDSIALKKAQVSVSLAGASTVAVDTAQIVLLNQGLQHLPFLFDLADDFHGNVSRGFAIVLVPTVIGIGGVFLLGFGIAQTIPLNLAALGLGIGNSMLPRLKYRNKE